MAFKIAHREPLAAATPPDDAALRAPEERFVARCPQGGEMNPKVQELWRQFLSETDPLSRDILYVTYMRALNES